MLKKEEARKIKFRDVIKMAVDENSKNDQNLKKIKENKEKLKENSFFQALNGEL